MSAGQDSVIGKIIATILPPKNEGVTARVIALPPSLQTTTQGQTIEGEVVQQYKDGSLRVQTQQGALEILVRGNNSPKPGQTIQIDIPKGDPPRQVVVREAQPNIPQTPVITSAERHVANARLAAQHVQSQQQIPTLNQPAPRTDVPQTPVVRTTAPPPQVQGQQPAPATPPPSSPLPGKAAPLPEQILNLIRNAVPSSPQQPLQAGQTVRLTPVTPLQAQQILQQPQSNPVQVLATRLPEAIITRASFEANLIAQNVQNANVQQVVQIPKDGIEQLVRLITGQQKQTIMSQNTTVSVATQTVAQNTPPLTQLATFPAAQQLQAQTAQPLQSLVTQIVTQGIVQQTVTQIQNFVQTQVQASLPHILFTQPASVPLTPQSALTNVTLPVQTFRPPQIVSPLQVVNAPQGTTPALSFPVQSIPTTALPQVLTQPLAQSISVHVLSQPGALPAVQTQTQNAFIVSIQPPGVQITPPVQAATQNFTALLNQVQSPAFPIINGSPQGVPAIVAGTTPQNLPVVILRPPALPLPQSFILQTPAPNIQTGTQILIRPQAMQVLTQPSLPQAVTGQAVPLQAQPLPLALLLQPGPWPIMDELYQGLLRVSPQAALALSQSVPNPGGTVSQLTPAALMFVAAVRSGDFASWLGGKTLDALQRIGKGNLPGRLGTEMASLNRGDAPVGEWRAVPLPMFWQGEIQKITLYTRQDRDAFGKDENDGQQTRFVFDLDLSRMGPVQLDGLIKGQRLDLIVRTELPFSEPMRQAMRQAYTDALYSTELTGELSFQGDTKHWVNVLQKDGSFGASA